MMSLKGIAAIIAVLVVFTFGSAKTWAAADAEEGRPTKESTEATEKISSSAKGTALYVLIDRNINENMNNYDAKNRNQVGERMDVDLIALLKKAGFEAKLIESRSEYTASSGAHLLVVKITDYSAGSKAARMVVGFGAGATSMNTHYDLYGSGSSPILSDDLGVGSGRDWKNVVRKINEQTVKAVSEKLGR